MDVDLPALPARAQAGHKGTFGTVVVVGGHAAPPRVMVGGPAFSAMGALRVGAGLAVLAVPEPIVAETLTCAPEATGLALPVDGDGHLRASDVAAILDQQIRSSCACLALGPGLGQGEPERQVVMRLIASDEVPLVIDADALNALAASPRFDQDLRAPAVLTPHPGEYRRLAATLDIDGDPVDPAQRDDAAIRLAQRLGCIVVLKGPGTIVTDGMRVSCNTTGSAALATGGSGDVLTGIIAGLIAQFFQPHLGVGSQQITPSMRGGLDLFSCAQVGVYLHGLAADRWVAREGEAGMLASDLLAEIPSALATLRDA